MTTGLQRGIIAALRSEEDELPPGRCLVMTRTCQEDRQRSGTSGAMVIEFETFPPTRHRSV
ncbi:MAG: hypothetical protein HYZ81_10370 [Nitrospinae bacterium]|nr:hypothetical protein [Nitrospinota bacterium]